ncbi:nuclear transport factor 2 family protein [Novosphingobium sp.]|uniref:nuclear transport factor 2 family protein n=1 Tax=Novosphingobium sp. TaxID=1874826 RepID=UPI0033403E9A
MAHSPVEEANLRHVLAMYQAVLIALDASRVDDFIAPHYVQHSTLAEPGVAALKRWLNDRRADSPDARQTIHRAFVDADHVIVHVHVCRWPGDRGLAVVDIFRLEHGMIVEHWDVLQDVPEYPVNPNPMF